MTFTINYRRLTIYILISILCLLVIGQADTSKTIERRSVDYEYSEAAYYALEYISDREGIPIESLVILDDHETEYPSLGRHLQVVNIMDRRLGGRSYKLLVDLDDGRIEEDISALLKAEAKAHEDLYRKLEKPLYERLLTINDDDTLPVAVWVAAEPGKSLSERQEAAFSALAEKYPEAKVAMEKGSRPMDVDDPKLAELIYSKYLELMDESVSDRVQSLIMELEGRGFSVQSIEGMPSFSAVLPKSVILELSNRDDVGTIYLIEAKHENLLDSEMPSGK